MVIYEETWNFGHIFKINYIYEIHMAQTSEKWIIRDRIDNLGVIFCFVFTLGP